LSVACCSLHRRPSRAARDALRFASHTGEFRVCVYRDESNGSEPTAIVAGAAISSRRHLFLSPAPRGRPLSVPLAALSVPIAAFSYP
jgi:hypothetical protein